MKKLLLLAGLLSVFSLGMAAEKTANFDVKVKVVDELQLAVRRDVDFGEVARNTIVTAKDNQLGIASITGVNAYVKLSVLEENKEVKEVTLGDEVVYIPVLYDEDGNKIINTVHVDQGQDIKIGGNLEVGNALNKTYGKTLTLKAEIEDF